ncbi:MAG: hypothetical protein ABIV63_15540 [Caldimonas sp.]
MKSPLERLDSTIWILIYGGLGLLGVGLALRNAHAVLAGTVATLGTVIAVVGVVLVFVRARKVRSPSAPSESSDAADPQ